MSNFGRCAFCGRETALDVSHIIPKFVFKWMKESSATGYIRFGQNPNRRAQDGVKEYFLCAEDEDRFSKSESSFASQIFVPYHNRTKTKFEYSEWMAKFCVSVSWRTLAFLTHKGSLGQMLATHQAAVEQTLADWRRFLTGEATALGNFEQHLIPLDAIESTTATDLPKNINRYLLRSPDLDVISSDDSAFVYTKLCRFILIGFIREPEAHQWQGTKVDIEAGRIAPSNLHVPGWLWHYINGRAQ